MAEEKDYSQFSVPKLDLKKISFTSWKDRLNNAMNWHTAKAKRRASEKGIVLGFTYRDVLEGEKGKKPISPDLTDKSTAEIEFLRKEFAYRDSMWDEITHHLVVALTNSIDNTFWRSHGINCWKQGDSITAFQLWSVVTTYYEPASDEELRRAWLDYQISYSMNYGNIKEYIHNVALKRAKVNELAEKELGKSDFIPESHVCLGIMSVMPRMVNIDGDLKREISLNRLESRLISILGVKNRSQVIDAGGFKLSVFVDENASTTEKERPRKRERNPLEPRKEPDSKRFKKSPRENGGYETPRDYCHYCKGLYNQNGKGHGYLDCPKSKDDKEKGISRKNIFSTFDKVGKYKPASRSDKAKKYKDKVEVIVDVNCINITSNRDSEDGEIKETHAIGVRTPDYDAIDDPLKEQEDFYMTEVEETGSFNINVTNDSVSDLLREFQAHKNAIDAKVRKSCLHLLNQSFEKTNDDWVLDSGCGHHLTGDEKYFIHKEVDISLSFSYGNGKSLKNSHKGSIKLYLQGIKGVSPYILPNVALVPGQTTNILSEFGLKSDGIHIIESQDQKYKYLLLKDTLIGVARAIKGVYYVRHLNWKTRQAVCAAVRTKLVKPPAVTDMTRVETVLKETHLRFCHLNKDFTIRVISEGLVDGIPRFTKSTLYKVPFFCQVCAKMNKTRMSFRNLEGSKASEILGRLHMDTCGPLKISGVYGTLGDARYFLSIKDDLSSFRWTYILKQKSQAAEKIKELLLQIEKENKHKVHTIRTDGGTEFVNKNLQKFCNDHGVKFQKSNRYHPEENGSAERDHGVKLSRVRSMLEMAEMAPKWWPYALMHATDVLNMTPCAKLLGKTPYEVKYGKRPSITDLPIWGLTCFAYLPNELRRDKKLGSRAIKCRFLGCAKDYKSYVLWSLEDNKLIHSRDVLFDSTEQASFIKKSFSDGSLPRLDKEQRHQIDLLIEEKSSTVEEQPTSIMENPTSEVVGVPMEPNTGILTSEPTPDEPSETRSTEIVGVPSQTRSTNRVSVPLQGSKRKQSERKVPITSQELALAPRPSRKRRKPGYLSDYVCHYHDQIESDLKKLGKVKITIPKNVKLAWASEHKVFWRGATDSEYDSLIENDTWKLVPLPEGRKALPCHWVLAVKYNADGTIERFKARLVINGQFQQFGVDFDEIYAPVARFESLRIILALGTILDCHIHQMDVSTAFLNGKLPDGQKIYMFQPPGYRNSQKGDYVCELKKSLYGLKQAPRIWYQVLHQFLTSIGFVRCSKEFCLYVRKGGDRWCIVVVYVDDLTILSPWIDCINQTKQELSSRFKMKDLGDVNYLLKVEIKRDRSKRLLGLSQKKYIGDLLQKYGLVDSNPVATPEDPNLKLVKETRMTAKEIAEQPYDYRGLIGSLQYLVRGSRPDLANVVRELSQFLSCYNKSHWIAALRVLKYLKGSSTYGLLMDGNQEKVNYEVYTDASFASREDRRSVSGFTVQMAGCSVSWSSRKQDCISQHTGEAELVALSEGIKESEWIYFLLREIGMELKVPVQVWCDSVTAIASVKNPGNHRATKHIEVRHLYARDIFEKGRIKLDYVSTHEMLADAMTKGLPTKPFLYLREKLGVKDLSEFFDIE